MLNTEYVAKHVGLYLTWGSLQPQGELTLKCSLTMKWPCPVMVVNGCAVLQCWDQAAGRPTLGTSRGPQPRREGGAGDDSIFPTL